MIGLTRGTVRLADYSVRWPEIAGETIRQLQGIFGVKAADIQHIGSTAIIGIKAKPIIDIAVGVHTLCDLEKELQMLREAGYRESHNRFSTTNRLFVMESEADGSIIRTHQIHILPFDSEQWHHYVDFRDYMNAFHEKAREYETLKIANAAECGNSQRVYTDGKQAYMKRILNEVQTWTENR